MADNDKSITNLRYNQVTQGLEGFGGGAPQWTPLTLVADGGISRLTGDVTAGPGSGSQAATVVKANGGAGPFASAEVDGNGDLFLKTALGDSSYVHIQHSSVQVVIAGSGALTVSNTVDVGGLNVTSVHDPVNPQDAATKNYVDTHGAAPGGTNMEIQFNSAGSFGGVPALTWDGTNLNLSALLIATNGLQISQNSDFGQYQIKSVAFENRTGTPGGPSTGQFWFDTVAKKIKFWDGSAVQTVTSA